MPVGVVLTIPATGSESSAGSVITNEEGHIKLLGSNGHTRPVFAIMDPEVTFTVPRYAMAVGGVDMMSHVMERYFTAEPHVELTDRLCEATLRTIIHNLPRTLQEPTDYDARAEIVLQETWRTTGCWTAAVFPIGVVTSSRIFWVALPIWRMVLHCPF